MLQHTGEIRKKKKKTLIFHILIAVISITIHFHLNISVFHSSAFHVTSLSFSSL